MKAPTAEILTIGTEILLGQIVDTNTATIAGALREAGINLYRTTTVGDNRSRIAAALQRAVKSCEIVITTGGLGPTEDDVTRVAIADALGAQLVFQDELWSQIQERYARFGRTPTENNRRQAYLPVGATAIENPVGTAPAFTVEGETTLIVALPGVPAEMEHLLEREVLPFLRRRFGLEAKIETRLVRVVGMGESAVDAEIKDLEALANPTVGVSAHPGRVDLRLAARAGEATVTLDELEAELRQRLGEAVYGVDDETLERVALRTVGERGWSLITLDVGTGGALASRLSPIGAPYLAGVVLPAVVQVEEAETRLEAELAASPAQVGLMLRQEQDDRRAILSIRLRWPGQQAAADHSYGGPPATAAAWGASLALDLLRRSLK